MGILMSYFVLAWSFVRQPRVEAIIVGSPGFFHVHWAWLLKSLLRKKSVFIYDAFIPLYEALVEDRQLISPHHFLAKLFYRFEQSCCQIVDMITVDTLAHGQYLNQKFGIDGKKIVRLFVGSTIQCAEKPSPVRHQNSAVFNILFVGTYIPLHGIDIILEAARLLRDDTSIRFTLVGSGQLRQTIEQIASRCQLSSIEFLDWVPTDELGQYIHKFELSLGIFGTTPKTPRVIPSKVYDICMAGVPFITADTPAIREVFTHRKNAYLIPAGDAVQLASAIRTIKQDVRLRETIASGAKRIGQIDFSPKRLSNDMISAIRMVNPK
ncbi:hypothetical protein DSCO28_00700 [Desulfosarcina ovata subsp. sediminis]|uniref:Glycosyl transferase family 1 domain-containing protein n=2 Tax=Desulfosarcina ovata TaxID=83564 RepID=A0A5K7ZE23_9BACT|nr:hypothetical protein DSCO28_00700 [Desulfosarcina ovata subsp. sediminis]